MRMMLKVSIPVESGNAAVRSGSLIKSFNHILNDLTVEAAYFSEEDGERTAYVIFDMQESFHLPAIAEPWFLAFNAKITCRPAMNWADLAKASPGIERAVSRHNEMASSEG